MRVGAAFEILPYVDIGGTLSIGMHLDSLLLVRLRIFNLYTNFLKKNNRE